MGFSPNDRFQVVEAATLAPGACALCTGSRGPFVDTAVTDKWNGYVTYICFTCLHLIVDNLPEEFSTVQEKIITLVETNEEAFDRAKSTVMDTLNVALNSLTPVTSAGTADASGSDLPGASAVHEDSGGAHEDAVSLPESSGSSSGNARRQGRNGVSRDTGIEPLPEPPAVFGFDSK